MDIVIIGAGIGGLCLAQALTKENIKFKVYEKSSNLDSHYCLTLRQSAHTSMLKFLPHDIVAKMADILNNKSTFYQLDSTLNTLMVIKKDTEEDKLYNYEKTKLLNLLATNINIEFNKEVTQIKETSNKIQFKVNGNEEECHLIVVCDGASSTIRESLFPNMKKVLNYSLINGKIPLSIPNNELGSKLETGPVLIYGDGCGLFIDLHKLENEGYISWSFSAKTKLIPSDGDKDALIGLVKEKTKEWCDEVKELLKISPLEIKVKQVESIQLELKSKILHSSSKILFLGDSAHPMTPYKGIGGTTAVEDVEDLINSLKKYQNSNKLDDLLSYNKAMTDRGFSRANDSVKACESLHTEGWLAQSARNVALKSVSAVLNFGK